VGGSPAAEKSLIWANLVGDEDLLNEALPAAESLCLIKETLRLFHYRNT